MKRHASTPYMSMWQPCRTHKFICNWCDSANICQYFTAFANDLHKTWRKGWNLSLGKKEWLTFFVIMDSEIEKNWGGNSAFLNFCDWLSYISDCANWHNNYTNNTGEAAYAHKCPFWEPARRGHEVEEADPSHCCCTAAFYSCWIS